MLPAAQTRHLLGLQQLRLAGAQGALCFSCGGDISAHTQHTHQAATVQEQWRLDGLHEFLVAVTGESQQFFIGSGMPKFDGKLVICTKLLSLLGRKDIVIGAAEQLGLGQAHQLFKALVALQVATIRVFEPNQIGHALNERLQCLPLDGEHLLHFLSRTNRPVECQHRVGHVAHQSQLGPGRPPEVFAQVVIQLLVHLLRREDFRVCFVARSPERWLQACQGTQGVRHPAQVTGEPDGQDQPQQGHQKQTGEAGRNGFLKRCAALCSQLTEVLVGIECDGGRQHLCMPGKPEVLLQGMVRISSPLLEVDRQDVGGLQKEVAVGSKDIHGR